jgi:hypothetical protein
MEAKTNEEYEETIKGLREELEHSLKFNEFLNKRLAEAREQTDFQDIMMMKNTSLTVNRG